MVTVICDTTSVLLASQLVCEKPSKVDQGVYTHFSWVRGRSWPFNKYGRIAMLLSDAFLA